MDAAEELEGEEPVGGEVPRDAEERLGDHSRSAAPEECSDLEVVRHQQVL